MGTIEVRQTANPNANNGLYGDVKPRMTDRFGILAIDGERYIVPEHWQWAVKMRKGQRRPNQIAANLTGPNLARAKATMRHIRHRMTELSAPAPRDSMGRFISRRTA